MFSLSLLRALLSPGIIYRLIDAKRVPNKRSHTENHGSIINFRLVLFIEVWRKICLLLVIDANQENPFPLQRTITCETKWHRHSAVICPLSYVRQSDIDTLLEYVHVHMWDKVTSKLLEYVHFQMWDKVTSTLYWNMSTFICETKWHRHSAGICPL